ncbi:hypothetical protein [Parablautia intestinalis]|nr:hypothetical protein [Parablautia intestinalis]
MNRSDSIVIRLDLTNRWIKGFCKTGNYHSGNPTPPAPEISRTIHEIVLARIYVTAGTTEITQDMIEDTRMDKELCGWVCGAVEQIDFEQIYAQFQTYQQNKVDEIRKWIDQFQTEKEEEIKTWFDNLREQLTEDPAINLQEQIGKIAELTTENKDNLVAAINEVKTSIPIPIANMLATEEGNPLDAVIGKELKDLHDANAEEITKLNGKFAELNQVKTLSLTANSKMTNYSHLYQIGQIKILSILFTTNSAIGQESLFVLPANAKTFSNALIPVNNGQTVQISVNKNIVNTATNIPAGVTVGGVLVFV